MPMTAPTGLRRVTAHLNPDGAPDGELLARFLDHRDEAAFAELVRRHGAMVFGTCRRVLGSAADADDAFQAAFVVLLRKAHGLTDRACVGNFLYGIAFHTALKAKSMAAKRRSREARAGAPEPQTDRSGLLAALDEELAKLPEKYRAPVVLCELEGRSRREAAGALGTAEGTISSRLATAHRMLKKRLRARGFAGVMVAALLVGQRAAASETLTEAAARALDPAPTVSQLASEVSKMMLLHKLGIGASVFAVIVAVAAVAAGSAPRAPADEPPKVPPAPPVATPKPEPAPAEKEPAWKSEFRKTYGLKDGELVRRVAPPYPECRAEYFKDRTREQYKRLKMDPPEKALNEDYTDYFTKFGWKDGWTAGALTSHVVPVKPAAGVQLSQLLQMTTGFQRTRLDADEQILETKVTGDWVVRAGADPEKLVAALETILQKECDLKVSLTIKDAEREVYVLSGKYESKPVPDRKKNQIELFARELGDRNTGGGGSGTLQEMADHAEGWIGVPIVLGKIEGAPKQVEWHYNFRSPFTKEQHAEDKDPTAVMTNVGTQTGLTVKLEKRTIKVLAVKTSDK
jgi:RNA polymerase sigma factor (sigma-70 family)